VVVIPGRDSEDARSSRHKSFHEVIGGGDLGRVIDHADTADGIGRAVAALRVLGEVVETGEVRQLGGVDLLEQAGLDALLAVAVGEIGDVDAGAIADLNLVQALAIIAGFEHDLAVALLAERRQDDGFELVAVKTPPGNG
jgi:hypothetical protein